MAQISRRSNAPMAAVGKAKIIASGKCEKTEKTLEYAPNKPTPHRPPIIAPAIGTATHGLGDLAMV